MVTTEPSEWTSIRTLLLLAAALVLLAVFLLIQGFRREPLLPLRIFAAPNLAAGNLPMALLGAAWIPLWFYLNLYLQQTLHLSALASGLHPPSRSRSSRRGPTSLQSPRRAR